MIIRMSAIRKVAAEAADNGLLAPELAQGIRSGGECGIVGYARRKRLSPCQALSLLSSVSDLRANCSSKRSTRSRFPQGDEARVPEVVVGHPHDELRLAASTGFKQSYSLSDVPGTGHILAGSSRNVPPTPYLLIPSVRGRGF